MIHIAFVKFLRGTIKSVSLLFLLLILVLSTKAQERLDIFSVSYNYNFMSTDNELESKNYESAIMAALKIPVVINESIIWYSSIDYHNFDVNNTWSPDFPNAETFNVHGFILRTGLIYSLSENSSLQVLFAPRYMSDMEASFSESMQYGGVLMYEKVKSEKLTYRLGVLYNKDFFGHYVVPVVYLDWDLSEKWKINGLLPVYGKLFWQSKETFSAGLHFIGLTTSYKIGEDNYPDHYIDRRSIDLSLFSNIHLFDNVFMEARLGYSLSKDYGLFDSGDEISLGVPLYNFGDDRTRLNQEYDPSMFFLVKLIYNLPID